ncbi:MAG: hypothetical protein ACTHJ5_06240 [Ilyomonas sp.]
MKRFLIRLSLFCLPLFVLIAIYVCTDPFKVIYHYDAYYQSGKPMYVELNRDYVSMETFRNNYSKYHYDSYILGNSRSRAYKVEDWCRHINSQNCFCFDANGEGLFGVAKKLEYLKKTGATIKNAMIIIDDDLLSKTGNQQGPLYIKHPLLSGQSSVAFQFEFLKAYFDTKFLKAYLDFKFSHKVKDYMEKGHLIDNIPITYNIAHNELRVDTIEQIIKINPEQYYKPRMQIFYKRDSLTQESAAIIKREQLKLLRQIKAIFKAENTNYRIVISPGYDQLKFNSVDLQLLKKIFGAENVFDFSGKNKITENVYNFYEIYHYRPHVATYIMDSIYGKKRTVSSQSIYYTEKLKGTASSTAKDTLVQAMNK